MAKTFTPTPPGWPLKIRIPWKGGTRFVHFSKNRTYTVVPDEDWPKDRFGVDINAGTMTETVYQFITGDKSEPEKNSKKKAKAKAPPEPIVEPPEEKEPFKDEESSETS